MEAVSPILRCRSDWEEEIDIFWTAMRAVFHMPDRSMKCGSHIHVSRGRSNTFSLSEFQTIAYGIVLYEPLILELLMRERSSNAYCKPNTRDSIQLRSCGSDYMAISRLIKGAGNTTALRRIMQDNRYVLWNFDNIVAGKSGTIEFRGGRCLRGEIRTKRWIAFTLALIDAILSMVRKNVRDFDYLTDKTKRTISTTLAGPSPVGAQKASTPKSGNPLVVYPWLNFSPAAIKC